MTRTTRRSLLAAVGVGLATAGCLTQSDGRGPPDATTTHDERTATTSDTGTASTGTETTTDGETTTGDWISRASKKPNPDHSIYLTNETDEARSVRIRVVRTATDETVFEEAREVESGGDFPAYNLERADPEGVETFEVCADLLASDETATTSAATETGDSNARDCVSIDTNECYGDAHVTVRDDGSLRIIYAIC